MSWRGSRRLPPCWSGSPAGLLGRLCASPPLLEDWFLPAVPCSCAAHTPGPCVRIERCSVCPEASLVVGGAHPQSLLSSPAVRRPLRSSLGGLPAWLGVRQALCTLKCLCFAFHPVCVLGLSLSTLSAAAHGLVSEELLLLSVCVFLTCCLCFFLSGPLLD